ncbi:formate dehydrogenase, partial [Porphyromonas gingivalis]
WENHGDHNDVDTAAIQTEVIQLPSSCFAEDEGALVNSGRWLQWHWPGAEPPGEAKLDTWIMAQVFLRVRDLYLKEGGVFPDPIVNLTWDYADANEPTPEELAKEMNGRALSDLSDPADPSKTLVQAGQQVLNFSQLRDDGSTACACW